MRTHMYTGTHTCPNAILSHKVLRNSYPLYGNEMCSRVIHTAFSLLCLRGPLESDPKQTEIIGIPLFASVGFGSAPEGVQH